jgi:predicted metal-dependent phosphoesterase TrpH
LKWDFPFSALGSLALAACAIPTQAAYNETFLIALIIALNNRFRFMLKVDLHCHSNVSDGVLAPAAVARYAYESGVDVWALTDHDEIGGIPAARQAAQELGMRFVPGVEISVTWANETVHVVGLQVDENNPDLVRGLAATRTGRDARGREISAQLEQAGIPGAYEGALKFVGNPDLMSRTHFARYLVECGACSSTAEVFRKYLAEGKPGYVPHRWATLAQAVGWIQSAGGVTGSHTPDQYLTYAELARRYGFMASRGTDFHAPGESRIEFAALPPLPAGLTPVWHDWF